MAASIPIEQESGISSGRMHSHNGYFAGDFTSPRYASPATGHAPLAASFDRQSS